MKMDRKANFSYSTGIESHTYTSNGTLLGDRGERNPGF
jgi:hypothetical protein